MDKVDCEGVGDNDGFFEHGPKQHGGKTHLLEFIKNESGMAEPLMINFSIFSEERILEQLAPYWFPHITSDKSKTPFENAKDNYPEGLLVMGIINGCHVNESIQFCYSEDTPCDALFGLAQNGGVAVLYYHDVVWFKEPDGSEYWARMS